MYHIYLDEEAVNAFALRLVKSEHFRDGTYTLYADVPVKCFRYEAPYYTSLTGLNTMDAHTANQTVDFVVAKGTDVILAITTEVMANKSRKLFKTVLRPIPHIEVSPAGAPQQKYQRLYHKVRDALEEREENYFSCFSLKPFPVELSEAELKSKCILNQKGNANAYGRDHGFFFRYTVGADGTLERHCVCCAMFSDYLRTVNYHPGDGSFEHLQRLLDTPIGELFRYHSDQWNELNDIMAKLAKLQSYPSFAPCDILEDYPELVYRLRCRDTDPEYNQIRDLTERLLICLAEVLGDEQTAERFEILRMPLRSYYDEAAARIDLYYPQWLYTHAVYPFLNCKFSHEHTLQDLLQYRSCLPANTPFPDLMELLVLPLYAPKQKM